MGEKWKNSELCPEKADYDYKSLYSYKTPFIEDDAILLTDDAVPEAT